MRRPCLGDWLATAVDGLDILCVVVVGIFDAACGGVGIWLLIALIRDGWGR